MLRSGRWRPLTEGFGILGPLALIALATLFFLPLISLSSLLAMVAFGLVWFAFRDPEREVHALEGDVLAPADGRVLAVRRVQDEYWQTEMIEVAIFLALWNVHVQRFPLAGTVVAQHRKAGGYKPAMTEAATHGNNQLAHYLQTAHGPFVVTQISGILARRIVPWVGVPTVVEVGQRLGMIKFGSQVTLRLPADATVLVATGDHVVGATTVVARLSPVATP